MTGTRRAAPPSRGPARRRLLTLLKLAVTVGLVVFLLGHVGGAEIADALAGAERGWLVAGLVLGALAAMLQANQWRGLLAAFGVRVRYWRCLRLDTAGRLFDAALPSNIGGDVVRIRLAAPQRADVPAAALAVGVRRVVSIPGLLLLVAVGVGATWNLAYVDRARGLSLACLAGGAVLGVLLLLASRIGRSAHARVPRPVARIRTVLRDARARAAGGDRHPFGRAMVRGLLFWVVVVASQGSYILAMGIDPPLGYIVSVVTCVNALSMIPISLGGYGLREGAFGALLSVGGLGAVSQGAAVGIVLSAQTLLFGLIGGAVYLTLGRDVASERFIPATDGAAVDRPTLTLDRI